MKPQSYHRRYVIFRVGIYPAIVLLFLLFSSCASMKNYEQPAVPAAEEGRFFRTTSGCRLYIYEYQPTEQYSKSIFLISGITGINHHAEQAIITQLSNNKHRVVVIHPRGTGYSEGTRGDMADFSDFVNDYVEILKSDKDYSSSQHGILLWGHSMSTAVLMAVASKLEHISGAILVNPPYMLKEAKGMSPSFGQYLQYAWYYLFQRHTPIVNMAGNPAMIENDEDRKEAELRIHDSLLVRYFSMYMMLESKKLMDSMLDYAKAAHYPVLLLYGEKDAIVEKKGCDMLFDAWKCPKKQYRLVASGTHGTSTALLSKDSINRWIDDL